MLMLIGIKFVDLTEAAGKMQSVEELEARMRQQVLNFAQQNNKKSMVQLLNKKTEEDLAAFKKLVRNVEPTAFRKG
jgi:predicted DNA binding CopG/RHH family protein